jgi:HPt (histidine-containing phosphotransfer) domain-containing protein
MHYDPTAALARIDHDTGLMTLLITVFIKECPKYIARLQAACDSQDLQALGDAAHNVKGASAAIGLEAASGPAEELEVACRQSGVKSIASFEKNTAQLIEVLAQCPEFLNNWIKSKP